MTTPRTHEGRVLPKQDEELVDQGLQFDIGTLVGRRRMLGLLGAGTVLGLTACAGSGAPTQELKTASDQTAAEKRASIRLQLAIGYFQNGKNEIALDEVKDEPISKEELLKEEDEEG